jgi:hypothetical protein
MREAGLPVNLAPAQLTRMSQLSDQWSFLWDKRRSLWIAAEDCPDVILSADCPDVVGTGGGHGIHRPGGPLPAFVGVVGS